MHLVDLPGKFARTRLETNATKTTVAAETVWNDGAQGGASGVGASTKYALPAWQKSAKAPKVGGKTGRGVPDVAGDADPQTGYRVRVDGQDQVIGGTSAVAPLQAGLLALCNQALGKPVGFLNTTLLHGRTCAGSVAGHYDGQQRRLSGGRGLGRLHGLGYSERHSVADSTPAARDQLSEPCHDALRPPSSSSDRLPRTGDGA